MKYVEVISPAIYQQIETAFNGLTFDKFSDSWELSKGNTLHLEWSRKILSESLRSSMVEVLAFYAKNYSSSHTINMCERFKHFVKIIAPKNKRLSKITSNQIINYRATIGKKNEWYLASLSGFLKLWALQQHKGIEGDILQLLDGWILKGNQRGVAVLTLCPQQGPLTDIEFESLHSAAIQAFEDKYIDVDDMIILYLFILTGRRPCQIADLKIKDIVVKFDVDNNCQVDLDIPRRKQRNTRWRTLFKRTPITNDAGKVLLEHIDRTKNFVVSLIGPRCLPFLPELPVFINMGSIHLPKNISAKSIKKVFESELLHVTSNSISSKLTNICKKLSVFSERTGERIHISPVRLRRTIATRAARSGYGSLVISEILDHTTDESAKVYIANVPEHVDVLNEAMSRQLAPLAQAFSGVLVSKSSMQDSKDSHQTVRTSSADPIGGCGFHGFCGALVPIACYTCVHFRPWLEGPHRQVLASLLNEREQILSSTNQNFIATVNDRTILAVTEVLQKCEAYYESKEKYK